MENIIDVRLLDAIRQSPGRVLKNYAMKINLDQEQSLQSIQRLVESGEVHRHAHSEKLYIPREKSKDTPHKQSPVKQTKQIKQSPKPIPPPVTESSAGAETEAPKSDVPAPAKPALTDIQWQILLLLKTETHSRSTADIAHVICRSAQGTGSALNGLVILGLCVRRGTANDKHWTLTATGSDLASQAKFSPSQVPDFVARFADGKPEKARSSTNTSNKPSPDIDATSTTPDTEYQPITDEQMEEFRRLPCSFNGMMQAVHRAGFEAALKVYRRDSKRWHAAAERIQRIQEVAAVAAELLADSDASA